MLGWSQDSHMNGGLGNACYGLCKTLSKKANITLVLPKAAGHATTYNEIKILEASTDLSSQHKPETRLKETIEYQHVSKTINIDIDLDPYFFPGSGRSLTEEIKRIKKDREEHHFHKSEPEKHYKGISHSPDIYDDDMLERVVDYAHQVTEIAKNLEFDIIHAHDWMTFLAGIFIKNATGKPLLLHVHSLDYDRAAGEIKSWVFDIERYCLSKADLVVPVSNYTAGIIYSRYGLSSKKVFTIHNGIAPVEMKTKIPKAGKKTILFAGRITGQKGWRYFLDISLKILKQYQNVKFIMAGDGPEMDDLTKSKIVDFFSDKIEITGHVDRDKLKELFSISDLFIMPSVSEPFGITALEAVQAGLPVVLSNRSGVTEILTSAPTANYMDTSAMAKHVLRLLKDDKLYMRTVKKLQKEAEHNTWEESSDKLMIAYRQLLKNYY